MVTQKVSHGEVASGGLQVPQILCSERDQLAKAHGILLHLTSFSRAISDLGKRLDEI